MRKRRSLAAVAWESKQAKGHRKVRGGGGMKGTMELQWRRRVWRKRCMGWEFGHPCGAAGLYNPVEKKKKLQIQAPLRRADADADAASSVVDRQPATDIVWIVTLD